MARHICMACICALAMLAIIGDAVAREAVDTSVVHMGRRMQGLVDPYGNKIRQTAKEDSHIKNASGVFVKNSATAKGEKANAEGGDGNVIVSGNAVSLQGIKQKAKRNEDTDIKQYADQDSEIYNGSIVVADNSAYADKGSATGGSGNTIVSGNAVSAQGIKQTANKNKYGRRLLTHTGKKGSKISQSAKEDSYIRNKSFVFADNSAKANGKDSWAKGGDKNVIVAGNAANLQGVKQKANWNKDSDIEQKAEQDSKIKNKSFVFADNSAKAKGKWSSAKGGDKNLIVAGNAASLQGVKQNANGNTGSGIKQSSDQDSYIDNASFVAADNSASAYKGGSATGGSGNAIVAGNAVSAQGVAQNAYKNSDSDISQNADQDSTIKNKSVVLADNSATAGGYESNAQGGNNNLIVAGNAASLQGVKQNANYNKDSNVDQYAKQDSYIDNKSFVAADNSASAYKGGSATGGSGNTIVSGNAVSAQGVSQNANGNY